MSSPDDLDRIAQDSRGIWTSYSCGLTRRGTPVQCLVHRDALAPGPAGKRVLRVLIVGGLAGDQASVGLALQALDLYKAQAPPGLAVSAIPCGNPDGLAQGQGPGNGAGGSPTLGYPPADGFFNDPKDPEARYLWRWIGSHPPDLVVEVQAGDGALQGEYNWHVPPGQEMLASALGASPTGASTPASSTMVAAGTLIAALGSDAPDSLGTIPGVRLVTDAGGLAPALAQLWGVLSNTEGSGPGSDSGSDSIPAPSAARAELDRRRSRSPLEVCRVLAGRYGHELEPVNYTQGVALSGRLRLGQLEGSGAHLEDVQAVVEPYVSGQKDIFPPDRVSTAGICGLLWTSEVFRLTSEGRYLDLLLDVMSRYQPGEGDSPPTPSDPDHRTEDMFMNACMLSRTGHLTGEGRYFDMAASALKAPRIQQEDGLFWHSLSTPYYWGRGNGFAALGYAEALTYLPREHPDRPLLIERHRKHLESLRRYQSPWGTYHQVINNPGSYQEFTSTCMIGYATARGLRLGWLDSSFRESMDRAWQAVLERIDDDGGLVDCCTNTGVQQSLQDYFDRPAIFGHDDRGGAMALWFATEYIQLSSGQSIII